MNDAIADRLKRLGAPPSVLGKLLSTPLSDVGWLDKAEIERWASVNTSAIDSWWTPLGKIFHRLPNFQSDSVKCGSND